MNWRGYINNQRRQGAMSRQMPRRTNRNQGLSKARGCDDKARSKREDSTKTGSETKRGACLM
ncbi:hypothetical protein EI94DRAFT_1713514, partial [Lactarius quietus]